MSKRYQINTPIHPTDDNGDRLWIDKQTFETFPKQSAVIGDVQKVRLCIGKRGQSYGCNRIYPVNSYADDLCSLANMKTFTTHTLQTAYVLGFLVIEEMPNGELEKIEYTDLIEWFENQR